MSSFAAADGVVEIIRIDGAQANAQQAADLLFEIPHGATRTTNFTSLEAQLKSPLPAGLVDFFHVNTDTGAPEMAEALCREFTRRHPTRRCIILRCQIPRTFIDCNRRIDASPADFKAGKVTPGLMPWIIDADDRALLVGRYRQYVDTVEHFAAQVMPSGAMVLMHTYAPRTVGVEVDFDIVKNLHAAYQPEVEPTWPLRPEIDVINKNEHGESLVNRQVFDTLSTQMQAIGVTVADGLSYPMHPSTLAFNHVQRWPDRVMCLEVRRDLLADPFTPFAQMNISAEKAQRLAGPMCDAVSVWF